jgi:hypothetical protein
MANQALLPVQFPGPAGAVFAPLGLVNVPAAVTGLSFTNNGQLALYLWTGTWSGNVTPVFGRAIEGQVPTYPSTAVSASTGYWFGPWSAADFLATDGTGNTYINFGSAITGTTTGVSLYQLVQRP